MLRPGQIVQAFLGLHFEPGRSAATRLAIKRQNLPKLQHAHFRIVKKGFVRYNHPCYLVWELHPAVTVHLKLLANNSLVLPRRCLSHKYLFRGSSAVERVAVNH